MKDLFWGFERNVKNSEVIQLPSTEMSYYSTLGNLWGTNVMLTLRAFVVIAFGAFSNKKLSDMCWD